MSFRLLVFDWDGTLMDSEARIVSSFQGAIAELGAEPRSATQIRDIIGLGLAEAALALYPAAPRGLVARLAEAYREYYLGRDPTPSRPFPGVRGVLEALRGEGHLLAIATGKARRGLDRVLGETGLVGLFDASRCADEAGSKPHPRMLNEILAELEVPAREALVIGDSEYDMEMAANAGARALAVSYGVHALERLLRHRPLGHIEDIRDLPAWLRRDRRCAGYDTTFWDMRES
jgi:phosphoglycolate phosphatase